MAKQINACCSICEKNLENIKKVGNYCNNCYNDKRRKKYNDNIIEARQKINQRAKKLRKEKQNIKEIEKKEIQDKIGENNKICKYCNKILEKTLFRQNRLKCLICERNHYKIVYLPKILERLKTDPVFKFKRIQRTRLSKKIKNKQKTTIEYLGCNSQEFANWLHYNSDEFNICNHSIVWHIDHVIPLSKFDLNNEQEQLIAFNWRNTSPMYCNENLKKGNKIIKEQIEQHYKKLLAYHIENKLDLPQVYIDLFAKHLDDGEPLKPSLLLTSGNICEDLG